MISLRPLCIVIDSREPNRANGNNNLFRVVTYPGGDGAVLAQELREYGLLWMLTLNAVAVAMAACFVARAGGLAFGLAGFGALCAALLATRLPPVRRWIELRGHEAEVQAAVILYAADEQAYRLREVEGMRRGYDGIFKDIPVSKVLSDMRNQSHKARSYVKARRSFLEQFDRNRKG